MAAKLISTVPNPYAVAIVGKAMSACFSYPEEEYHEKHLK